MSLIDSGLKDMVTACTLRTRALQSYTLSEFTLHFLLQTFSSPLELVSVSLSKGCKGQCKV